MAYKYTLPVGFVLKGGENEYVIEQVLGKGGFGITYKVKARLLYKKIIIDAYFAVKEYFPDICSRDADNATIKIPETKHDEIVDGIRDFLNEGRKLQAVCDLNPNIVNVNEVFEANGTAYYVLEYLEGGDLRKMVKNNGGALNEQQMLDVMLPIGRAVQCLHDNRMLHLDIKPDNIVMRFNNNGYYEPVLIDFGIAVHFRSDGTPTSKTPSQGISPGYSPIEQYALITTFDPRIDIYAFSATCLYLITDKDPIESMSLLKQPNYIKSIIPTTISERVANAIENGMSLMVEGRPQSMNAMIAMLNGEVIEDVEVVDFDEDADVMQKNTFSLVQSSKPTVVNVRGPVSLETVPASDSSDIQISDIPSNDKNIIINVNGVKFTMVAVDGGTFIMGSKKNMLNFFLGSVFSDEKPAHEVTLSSYYIGQTEVTQELWEAVMGSNPSDFKGAKRPVENVSWDDCQEFIRRLNKKTGKNFRLPTEAEWEYAARGGNRSQGYKYSGSNNIDDVAWYWINSGDIRLSGDWDFHKIDNNHCQTHDVATKRANELGLYDMSGNVLEWCNDWFGWGYYKSSPSNNPQGPSSGSARVLRGGSWHDPVRNCRVSYRHWASVDNRYDLLGVRLAL